MKTKDNLRFSHKESGSRDNPTLLFLHGFLGKKEDWKEVIKGLTKHYHCVSIDLPGHGQTEFPSGQRLFGFSECADSLGEFLLHTGIDSCSLIGYSMGGRLGLYFALRYPKIVDKLILESSSPGLKNKHQRAIRQTQDEKWAAKLEAQSLEDFLREWYSQPLFESIKENHILVKTLIQDRLGNNPKGLSRSLLQLGTGRQPNLWPLLSRLEPPLLQVVGKYDLKFTKIARDIKLMHIPSSFLALMETSGHNVHLEAPQFFTSRILSFLSDDKVS